MRGFSTETIDIILSSWRDGTKTQYQTTAKKWFEFCKKNKCDVISPPLPLAMSFLSGLFKSGLSYSSINTARSALSSMLSWENNPTPFGNLPIVKRFMKGIYESRPALPRYCSTWSVKTVFDYLRAQKAPSLLPLKDLSHRVTFLLSILSGQRCQTIQKLSIDHMTIEDSKITFVIVDKLKHSRPGVHQQPLVFVSYPIHKNLCVITYLLEYLKRTSSLRGQHTQLLISFVKPHKPISNETVSHWIKNFMATAGIDTSQYKGHSTRAASTSHLASKDYDLKDIMSAAGWSKEETFQRFYHFDSEKFNFGRELMNTLTQ